MRVLIVLILLMPILAAAEMEQYLIHCQDVIEEAEEEGEYDPTYCRRAADLGSPHAHYVMGMYYMRQKDWDKARMHYQTAADGGFVWGHIGLGHGLISSDPEAAEMHYRVVAESDDEMAIVALAWIGDLRLRDEDFLKAYSWFYACAHFDTSFQNFCNGRLSTPAAHLDSEQMDRAVKAAQPIIEWFSHNKGFNRTPESSAPAKPGEPSGGAG